MSVLMRWHLSPGAETKRCTVDLSFLSMTQGSSQCFVITSEAGVIILSSLACRVLSRCEHAPGCCTWRRGMGNGTLRVRHFQKGCTTVHAHQRAALAPGTRTASVPPRLHQLSHGKLYLTFYFTVSLYYKYTSFRMSNSPIRPV